MKQQEELLYPFFLNCCKYAVDEGWSAIFEDMAYGIFPHQVYMNKGYLSSCNPNVKKAFSYRIDSDMDDEQFYNKVYDLLSKKIGLKSQQQSKNHEIWLSHNLQSKNSFKSWKDIKKNSDKVAMLERYITKNNIHELHGLISICMMLNVLDVVVKDDFIVTIRDCSKEKLWDKLSSVEADYKRAAKSDALGHLEGDLQELLSAFSKPYKSAKE